MKSYEDSLNIEKAIKFLVYQIDGSGDNPKPVILHSIRVALNLDTHGYSTPVVVAALLHDLLEDSRTSLTDIKKEFGETVAKLVKANSFDKSIADKTQRYIEAFNRCLETSRDALLIKTADILDNADYYSLANDQTTYAGLIKKLEYFLNLAKESLKDEPIYNELLSKYKELTAKN